MIQNSYVFNLVFNSKNDGKGEILKNILLVE